MTPAQRRRLAAIDSGVRRIECDYEDCQRGPAVETHVAIYAHDRERSSWIVVCRHCINRSRSYDRNCHEDGDRYLYLPIVQPVVDSAEAICVEFILARFCEIAFGALRAEQFERLGKEGYSP